jgi:hypothetical protein
METYQLWEGKEGRKTIRRLIRSSAMYGGNDETEEAMEFFGPNVKGLQFIGEVMVYPHDDEKLINELGDCFLQERG